MRFTDERFKAISAEAKVFYGLLLDRMSLSVKNGWLDKDGRVFIMLGMRNVHFTKEALLKLNRQLNKIKKPGTSKVPITSK